MSKSPTILLTRPEPGATSTASSLEAHGFNVIKLPFTEMVAKRNQVRPSPIEKIDAVVVTSANAIRFVDIESLPVLLTLPLFAVGDATAKAAREAGFEHVRSADGNAQDLCELVISDFSAGARLVYLCGQTRTDDVERILSSEGFELTVVETYQTNKVSQLTYNLDRVFDCEDVNAITFYSSVSATYFATYIKQQKNPQTIDIDTIFCISQKAKMCLPVHLHKRIIVSAEPRDDAMIARIFKYYSS